MNPIQYLLKIKANLYKTIYINFKFFPWKVALKLPIVIVGKVDLGKCEGKIVLKDRPRFAMLIVGSPNPPNTSISNTTFWIDGTLELSDHVRVLRGSSIHVSEGALLTIGREVRFNVSNKIWCTNHIDIGSNCRFSWECQVLDANFHYIVDSSGKTKRHTGIVVLGESCFIANRVTINKGTVLPNFTIVAANSFVNRDFTQYGEAPTIGGLPAKFIRQGMRRIMNLKKEREIDAFFRNHPEEETYEVGNDPSLFHWY